MSNPAIAHRPAVTTLTRVVCFLYLVISSINVDFDASVTSMSRVREVRGCASMRAFEYRHRSQLRVDFGGPIGARIWLSLRIHHYEVYSGAVEVIGRLPSRRD